jgi:hypothetical protein
MKTNLPQPALTHFHTPILPRSEDHTPHVYLRITGELVAHPNPEGGPQGDRSFVSQSGYYISWKLSLYDERLSLYNELAQRFLAWLESVGIPVDAAALVVCKSTHSDRRLHCITVMVPLTYNMDKYPELWLLPVYPAHLRDRGLTWGKTLRGIWYEADPIN